MCMYVYISLEEKSVCFFLNQVILRVTSMEKGPFIEVSKYSPEVKILSVFPFSKCSCSEQNIWLMQHSERDSLARKVTVHKS